MLENERIVGCNWSIDGGHLVYDISHLDPDAGVLIQSYQIYHIDALGRRIFASDFVLFPPSSDEEKDFGSYPKEFKIRLWEIIFAVKRKFFEEVSPDVVTHFIDAVHSMEKRHRIYSRWLFLPNYIITKTKQQIIYTKATPIDFGGGSSF